MWKDSQVYDDYVGAIHKFMRTVWEQYTIYDNRGGAIHNSFVRKKAAYPANA